MAHSIVNGTSAPKAATSSKTSTVTFDALLFDMDGTMIDSTKAVIGAWQTFAKTYPFLDLDVVLRNSHGVRTIENLRNFCLITDDEILATEVARFEQEIVNCAQEFKEEGKAGINKLPGVSNLLAQIDTGNASPQKWAICTSATKPYATAALSIAEIPLPTAFVTAEDVSRGKPFPDPYLLAAKRCSADPHRCLVLEDAPSGIRSGKAAGAKVVAVITSHERPELEAAGPDWIVPDLSWVTAQRTEAGIEITVREP